MGEASHPVVHGSARRETLQRRPPGSGTRHIRVAITARGCGVLGGVKGKSLELNSDQKCKQQPCTSPRVATPFRLKRLGHKYVVVEWVKVRTDADHSG